MVIIIEQWSRDGRKPMWGFRVDNKFGSVIRIDVKPLVGFRWGCHLDQVASIINMVQSKQSEAGSFKTS